MCKGKGYIRGEINLFLGVITLGLTALMDLSQTERCHSCYGLGYLEQDHE